MTQRDTTQTRKGGLRMLLGATVAVIELAAFAAGLAILAFLVVFRDDDDDTE